MVCSVLDTLSRVRENIELLHEMPMAPWERDVRVKANLQLANASVKRWFEEREQLRLPVV